MTATLTVLSGPLAGARLDVADADDDVLVGSDPDCRLALDLPGVSPIHARLAFDQGSLIVSDTHSPRGLYVNDARVEGQTALRDGDVIWLGTPGDESSVMIQCRLQQAAGPGADAIAYADEAPPDVVDPMADLGDLLAIAPPDDASPASAGSDAPADDVFFMEEPPPPAVVPTPPSAPPPPQPPRPPAAAPAPPPRTATPPPSVPAAPPPPEDALFFVEEPATPAVVPPPARPAPPVAAPPPVARPAVSAAPKASVKEVPAVIGSVPAERPIRRHGPTPAPSAALESEGDAEPPRPRSAPPRAAAAAPPSRRSKLPLGLIAGAAGVLLVAGVAGVMVLRSQKTPAIESITPLRVGLGHSVTIAGAHFAATPQGNVVRFGGKAGRVMQASPTRLQVEIPEMVAAPGRDTPVPVVVVVDGHESKPVTVGVFQSPRIHGIAPTVAMPGEEVVLAGAGWGAGAKVQFGPVAATVVDSSPTSLKVVVPALEGAPGTEFPVRVGMGADTSNPAPFVIGRLPLLLSVAPASAAPGDLLTLTGRGFDIKPLANDVRIAGTRALVTSASGGELKVVVPRAAAGDAVVEIRVPGVENVGQSKVTVAAGPDPIDFRFVAEPFEDAAGHDHALLATGLGPAFVLSASGGRSAAERAFEAARRLSEAGAALKGAADGGIRARGLDGSPSLVVAGRDTPLLEVTLDDAAAYEEDWTGLKGRGGPVSPARVAVWWEAVARDLVLLLVRGDKPHFAADLAPEGRVFADLHPLARKAVAAGVPRQIVAEARPQVRDALRTVGLRIPVSVKGPASAIAAGPDEGAPAAPGALKLEGRWSGSETESGRVTYIVASFAGAGGTFTHERALSVTQPLRAVEQQKGLVRFSVQTGAGPRYYQGRWDGQKVSGTVSVDPGGRTTIATFELAPG